MRLSHDQCKMFSVAALSALALSCLLCRRAEASGTPAGTLITNQALASYRSADGEAMPAVLSNTIAVIVGQVAAVNITPVAASGVGRINAMVDYAAAITNSGNGTDNLQVSAVSSHGFPAKVYRDANGDGVITQGDVAAGPVQETGPLPADSSLRVIVRVAIPADNALNGQTDLVSLTAASAFEPSVKGTGSYSTLVSSAALAMTLSVDNTMPRGGDRVTYTLAYVNGGSAPAGAVQATGALNHFLNYVTASGSPPPATVSGQTLSWSLGTIAAGASGIVTFQADLVNNAVPGTEIHDSVEFHYLDGANPSSGVSTERNFITVQAGGAATVDLSPASAAASGEPGDSVLFPLTVTNNGASPESFALSSRSSLGLPWTLYLDANGNGRVDSNEAAAASTGPIAPNGGRCRLLARAPLPVVQADGTADQSTFTVTSSSNAANVRAAAGTTVIRIPVMTLTKTADARDPRSGNEILYRISYRNTGGGHAFAFAIEDSIPARTTYVPESVTLNSLQKTDEADADEVLVAGGAIIARLGTVNPQQSGVLAFRVRIN